MRVIQVHLQTWLAFGEDPKGRLHRDAMSASPVGDRVCSLHDQNSKNLNAFTPEGA